MIGYLILVAVLVVILVLPTRLQSRMREAFRRLVGRLRPTLPASQPTPEETEVEVLLSTLELARLAAEVEKARSSNRPAKMVHITATVAAYDTVLLACCRSVGLPLPAHRPPLPDHERMEAELALIGRGVEW